MEPVQYTKNENDIVYRTSLNQLSPLPSPLQVTLVP